MAELCTVFKELRSRGTKVAFDPGPWLFLHASHERMVQAWAYVACLIGTESELSPWYKDESVMALVDRLLTLGPQQVVVKRGSQGVAFGEAGAGARSLPTERVDDANAVETALQLATAAVNVAKAFSAHWISLGETGEKTASWRPQPSGSVGTV